MGGGMSRFTDSGARGLFKLGLKPQAPTDATYLVGTTFDRTWLGYPQSMEACHNFSWTSSAGASGASLAVETSIYSGDKSDMSDESLFKTRVVTITWVADAAKQFLVTLDADLSAAKRYVRVKFKETKAGTVTVGTPLVAQIVRFGGLAVIPNPAYSGAGYFEISGGGDTAA